MLVKAPKPFGELRRQNRQRFIIDFSPRIHYNVKDIFHQK